MLVGHIDAFNDKNRYDCRLDFNQNMYYVFTKLSNISSMHGYITVRNAIHSCESNNECAGFTYHGPVLDLEFHYDIYFFR